jgi:hypothetical protein
MKKLIFCLPVILLFLTNAVIAGAIVTKPDKMRLAAITDPTINMAVDIASLNFGSVAVGQAVTRKVKVTNMANSQAVLNIGASSLPEGYSILPSGAISIPVGGSQVFTITFQPTAAGNFNLLWNITNNSSNLQNPYMVTLNGNGYDKAIVNMTTNDFQIVFGSFRLGSPMATRMLTISNASTSNGPLNISLGSLNLPFSYSGPGSIEIRPGESKTIMINFIPVHSGTYSGTLLLNNNSTNRQRPFSIPLTGSSRIF